MLRVLHHVISRYRTTKNVAKLALTGLLFCIPFTASHACSVHNHGCIYHGFNAAVNTSYPTTNTDTSVVLYSIGKTPNTGTPSNVDFDNKVWIPELTGVKDASGNYTTPTGAYILNNTAYGTTHPPADTYAPDDRYRLVYPSQYQITFNQNSAVAKHTGDFNGAENGNIPNATGCPNMPNAANCEAVVVTGNVPTGFYDQQVRIFNSTGNPNPAVDLQVGVYTTGKARLVTPSHIDNRNETADFQSISGTGATTPLYRYEIVNTGYDPHAGGVAWFDRNRTYTTGYGKPYIAGSHIYQNRFDTTDTTRTKIYKYGAGEQSLQARNFSTKHLYLGEVAQPPPPPVATPNSKFDLLGFVQNKSDADKFMSGFPSVTAEKYGLTDSRNAYWAGYNPASHTTVENLKYGFSNSIQGVGKGVVNLGWMALNGGAMIGSLIQEPFNPGAFEKSVSYYENNRDIWKYDNGTQQTSGFFTQIGVPLGGGGTISKTSVLTQGAKVENLMTSSANAYSLVKPYIKGNIGVVKSSVDVILDGHQILGKEVTLLMNNGQRIRADLLIRNTNGAIQAIESKFGLAAKLTENQQYANKFLSTFGGVLRTKKLEPLGYKVGEKFDSIDFVVQKWLPW